MIDLVGRELGCQHFCSHYAPSDMQHTLFLLTTDNRLGLAPPNDEGSLVKRAIDIGTGTGIWAIDFGEEHPEADVSAGNTP